MHPSLPDDVLARIEAPVGPDDADDERWRRARLLLAAVEGDREHLFELRSLFLLRLHRSSADVAATEGLIVVERALASARTEPLLPT